MSDDATPGLGHQAPDHVLAIVAALHAVPPRAGGIRVLAVDGPSGAGKSTLAVDVARVLGAPIVRMDDLYPGWDGLEEAVPRLLEWVLRPLAAGRRAWYRRYDWNAGRYAEWHEVPAGRALVIEGVSCGSRICAPYLSLLVWVEADPALRMERGMARDGEAYRPHWERWARQEDEHFAREGTRDRADVRVVTDGR